MNLDAFARHLSQELGLAESTIAVYSRMVANYQKWLGQRPETPELAAKYIATFPGDNTRSVVASALRTYFAWAHPDTPLKVRVKVPQSLPKPITRGELWLLVRGAEGSLKILILLMAFAGLRVTEACELRSSSILQDNQALRILGKGRKERLIPIPRTLHAIFKAQVQGRRVGSPVFPGQGRRTFLSRYTVEHALSALGDKVGVHGMHPHRLRHFYASWRYALTKDAFLVAREMGHSDPKTTYGYAGLVQVPVGIECMEDLLKEVLA